MKIDSLMASTGQDAYYTDSFRLVVETQLTNIWKSPNIRMKDIDPHTADKYEGDLYGLLDSLNIPKQYHYFVLITNMMISSSDYTKEMLQILIPDFSEIDQMLALHLTRNSNI